MKAVKCGKCGAYYPDTDQGCPSCAKRTADWCLCKPEEEVYFGSSDDIRRWHNVPVMVIVNVPDNITLTERELLQFIKRQKGAVDPSLVSNIMNGDMHAQPPKYVLVRLGEEMPDEDMRYHFTRLDPFHPVYDWQRDNKLHKKGKRWEHWYDPKDEYSKAFHAKHGILTREQFRQAYGDDYASIML